MRSWHMESEAESEVLSAPTHTHLHGACRHLSALSGLPHLRCSTVMTDSHSYIKYFFLRSCEHHPTLKARAEPALTSSSQEAVGKLAGHMPNPGVQRWPGKVVWKQLCFCFVSHFISRRSHLRGYQFSALIKRNGRAF